MNIFVINAGSSSLKYQLFDMDTGTVKAKGLCERIGENNGKDGVIKHKKLTDPPMEYEQNLTMPNHSEALSAVLFTLMNRAHGVIRDVGEIHAVGHRVVHGGEWFASSVLIDDAVMDAIEECAFIAPLHNPANISGIEACRRMMGNIPQVAVFDTAFHQSMPKKAYTYALPYEYYDKYKVRRYGFHGTSHRYVSAKAAEVLGRPIEDMKIISCHLGSGSSVCAISRGQSIDTSMGFTPVAGVPMSTRSGDIDAGVIEFLMKKEDYSLAEMMNIINSESGVLGISGVSKDFRDIEKAALNNGRARLALEVFDYNVTKAIGAYAAAMNGVDTIIFTAGLGENSPETRESICRNLEYLGLVIDHKANEMRGTTIISKPESKVSVVVIPTDEELVIAMDTMSIIEAGNSVALEL